MTKYQIKLQLKRNSKIVGEAEGEIISVGGDIPKAADLLPWFAFLISLLSIIFTAFQANETRNNNRIAVIPQLVTSRFGLAKKSIGIFVENDGLGPAVVKRFNIFYQHKKLESVKQLREAIVGALNIPIEQLPYIEIENGYFYRASQRVDLLSEGASPNTLSDENRKKVWEYLSKYTDIAIMYCSVYDECHYSCLHRTDKTCLDAN